MKGNLLRELRALGLLSPWALWRAARNFVKTVWDPTRSDIGQGVNHLIDAALRDAPPERIQELARRRPDLVELFAEGYDPDLDPGRLASLPEGSLGREYARFIRANGIDPLATLLAMGTPTNALQYFFRRAYKLHDLMHVALGCDASVLGEVRIVSYSLGQAEEGGNGGRAPAMALAVLFLHLALRRPEDVRPAIRLAHEWLRLGERSRPHVSFRIEDHLERPVAEVRELLLAAS